MRAKRSLIFKADTKSSFLPSQSALNGVGCMSSLPSLAPKAGDFPHLKNDNDFLHQLSILFHKMVSVPLGTTLPTWVIIFVHRQPCSNPASLHRCSTWDVFFWASQFPASVSTAPGDSPTQTSVTLPGTANLSHLPFPKRELSSPTPGSSQFTSVCDKHKPYPAPERPHCLPLGDLCHPKCICSHKLLSQV